MRHPMDARPFHLLQEFQGERRIYQHIIVGKIDMRIRPVPADHSQLRHHLFHAFMAVGRPIHFSGGTKFAVVGTSA